MARRKLTEADYERQAVEFKLIKEYVTNYVDTHNSTITQACTALRNAAYPDKSVGAVTKLYNDAVRNIAIATILAPDATDRQFTKKPILPTVENVNPGQITLESLLLSTRSATPEDKVKISSKSTKKITKTELLKKDFWTIAETAIYLNVSTAYLYDLIKKDPSFPAIDLNDGRGASCWRIKVKALQRWLEVKAG